MTSRERLLCALRRESLEVCMPGGGFAFGVGNWVADTVIPPENHLATLEAARTLI